jgi:hypothetical protein
VSTLSIDDAVARNGHQQTERGGSAGFYSSRDSQEQADGLWFEHGSGELLGTIDGTCDVRGQAEPRPDRVGELLETVGQLEAASGAPSPKQSLGAFEGCSSWS